MAVALGNAAGRGEAAALVKCAVLTEIDVYLSLGFDAVEVITRTNRRLSERHSLETFVTMVLVTLDISNHEITLVNAGHPTPLLRRHDGGVIEIGQDITGLPIGVLSDQGYENYQFSIDRREALLLFSDEVIEANNTAGELYGTTRLSSALSACDGSAKEIIQSVRQDMGQFGYGEAQSDDVSLFCLKRV